jgi:dienelactone hydrolase
MLLLSSQWARAADDDYRVLWPATPSPHPVVLLVPGCSGFAALNGLNIYEERADALRAGGHIVVFVDYLGRFGSCGHMSHAEVGDAILQAAGWVRDQPDVDPSRIAVIGWSFGGGGVIAALRSMQAGAPRLARAVMYYPDSRGETAWSDPSISALMFLGNEDNVTRPALCEPVAQGVPPHSLTLMVYPNAFHGFDVRSLPQRAEYPFGTLGYNAGAATDSWARVGDFLR